MSFDRSGIFERPKVEKIPPLKAAFEENGLLIVQLLDESHARLVKEFLDMLKTEYLFDDGVSDAFDYQYKIEHQNGGKFFGFAIYPKRVTVEGLLWDFGTNKLIEKPKGLKPKMFKDNDTELYFGL